MISITRMAQSKKNLEQDLKRIFDTAKKRAETKQGTMSFPSTLSMEEMARKSIGHDLTEEEKAILQETSAWKAMVRCGKIMDRLSTMLSPFNRLAPPFMAISYDLVVHPFLYEDWRLNYAEIDFTQFDMSLSSSEIYDIFQQCNSDLISVFVSKLDNCSQAEKEHIIAAYENGNREEFIKHLRLLSNEDYRILCLFAYLFHIENSLVSFDEDTLNVLLHVVDFGDEARLSAGDLLPCKKIIDFISFPLDFELKDNPTEEEIVAYFNKISDVFEPYLKNVEAIYSYLKYDLPRVFESMNPFPFERKYLEDLLNDPEVKAILADLSEKPNEDASPDEQEQPESQPTLAPTEGQEPEVPPKQEKNRKTPGREPEKWFKGNWSEEEFKAIIDSKIYPFLKEELKDFVFDDETHKSESKKQTAITAAAAAIILYSSERIGLPRKPPITTCSLSMSRTLSAPKSSVSVYLKALNQWYHVLLEISKDIRRSKEALTIVEGWKKTDLIRGSFIGHNFKKLQCLINNTAFLLGQALDIKTDLVYMATGGAYDRALYKASEYDESIQIDNNGHKHNTARKMSDGADED